MHSPTPSLSLSRRLAVLQRNPPRAPRHVAADSGPPISAQASGVHALAGRARGRGGGYRGARGRAGGFLARRARSARHLRVVRSEVGERGVLAALRRGCFGEACESASKRQAREEETHKSYVDGIASPQKLKRCRFCVLYCFPAAGGLMRR